MPVLLITMLKEQLEWAWITIDDLKKDVVNGLMSKDDYKAVVGQDYVA